MMGMVEKLALLPRERLVLELHYGLNGDASAAQREVAQTLGISRSYVSRLEKRAIERLAQAFREEDGASLSGKNDVNGE